MALSGHWPPEAMSAYGPDHRAIRRAVAHVVIVFGPSEKSSDESEMAFLPTWYQRFPRDLLWGAPRTLKRAFCSSVKAA